MREELKEVLGDIAILILFVVVATLVLKGINTIVDLINRL